MAADKCACYAVTRVASARIDQDSAKYCAIIAKGLRCVDELGEIRNSPRSCWGHPILSKIKSQLGRCWIR